MKKLGENRIEALSLQITAAVASTPGLTVGDKGAVVLRAAAALRRSFGEDGGLDTRVRARIASLSREIPEGSREWEVLYRQYRDEFSRRR